MVEWLRVLLVRLRPSFSPSHPSEDGSSVPSEDVKLLVHDLAAARLQHVKVLEGRQRLERRSEAGELAILTGQIRRWLSVEGVRSQARCLIDRVGALGAGAAAATKRRQWALHEEARMSRERNAHQLCLAQGHYALRRGQFQL